MSDAELTTIVMLFTAFIIGLGLWIGRNELFSKEKNISNIKTDYEIEISRRNTAGIVGKIMLVIVAIALSKTAVRRELEKVVTGQYNFTPELLSILAVEVLWISIGILLLIYSKRKVLI